MRFLMMAALCCSVFVFFGCTPSSPEARLVGKWELDLEATKEVMKAELKDNPVGAMMLTALDSMKATAEFKADGTASLATTAGGRTDSKQGKFVIEKEGERYKVTITDDAGEKTSGFLAFEGNDKFSLEFDNAGPNKMKMTYLRMKG